MRYMSKWTALLSLTIAVNFNASAFSADIADPAGQAVIEKNTKSVVLSQNRGEWNGYKGYRHHRKNYQKNIDGWWYPQAAFHPNAKVELGVKPEHVIKKDVQDQKTWMIKSHIDYCSGKYKSYTPSDNSYQPAQGVRKACMSPYFKK